MRSLILTFLLSAAAAAAPILLDGSGQSASYTLKPGDVLTIDGSSNAVKIDGAGSSIQIDGSFNKLEIDAKVTQIRVDGFSNTFRIVERPGRPRPEIVDINEDNAPNQFNFVTP